MTRNEFSEICKVFGEIWLSVGKNLTKNNDKTDTCTSCVQAKNEEVMENTVPNIKEDMKEEYCYNKKLDKYCLKAKGGENNKLKGLEKIKNEKVQEAIKKELKSMETRNINLNNKGIYIDKDILISISSHAQDIGDLIRDLRYIKNEDVKKFFNIVEESTAGILKALNELRKVINNK